MPKRIEEIEQAKLIKWSHKAAVRALLPELRWLFHVPNGGLRSGLAGAQMKALGAKPGVPDLILPVGKGLTNGLIIEMKSETGRPTPEQKEWMAHFEAQQWSVRVARSAQEARTILCMYLGVAPANVPALEV